MSDSRPSPASPRPQPAAATSTGLAPNAAGALAYLLGPITGILFLVLERENRFVRFHAAQSIGVTVLWIGLSVVFTVLGTVLGAVPVIGWLAAILLFLVSIPLTLAGLALWLFLMYRAYQGHEWEVPLVGPHARRFADPGVAA